jgi:tetratricopeptide (TPR) repeat protein
MKLDLRTRDALVTCDCGAVMKIGCAGLEKYVCCRNCGRQVNITDRNTHAPEEHAHNALVAYAEKQDTNYRHRLAIRLVRENKFCDALDLYQSILDQGIQDRDVYYGAGYCLYRLKSIEKSRSHLATALAMRHPSAAKLLRKIERALNPG